MTVALDIGPSVIKAVSTRGRKVVRAVSVPLTAGLMRDGLILQPAAVGAAIAGLFRTSGIPKDRVVVSVTGVPYSYRLITLPGIKPSLREEAVGRAVRREMPLPPEELSLTWQLVRRTAGELEYFVIGVPRNVITAVTVTLKSAGISSFTMDLRPLALARLAGAGQAIVADVSPDSIEIAIVAGGIPVVMHSVTPRPGATAEDTVRRFVEELGKTVMFYNSSRPAHPVEPATPLFLSGELAAGAREEMVMAASGYPVQAMPVSLAMPAGVAAGEYAVCLGLVLKTLGLKVTGTAAPAYQDINVDVAVNRYGVRRAGLSPGSLVLPLVTVVLLCLAYWNYTLASGARAQLVSFESQAAVFSQMLRQARVESEASRSLVEQAKAVLAQAESLETEQKGILARRARFERPLRRLWELLPPTVFFTGITVTGDTIEVTGEAESGFEVLAYAAAFSGEGEVASARVSRLDSPRTSLPGAPATRVAFTLVVTLKPAA